MSDALVIIPTYNEIENIDAIVNAIFAKHPAFHILVVDDNSPDGTAARVATLQNSYKDHLFILNREEKKGLGVAYIAGFKWALSRDYQFVFEMDADYSHDPNDLARLYAACKDDSFDVAVGSRYVKGVNVVNWPLGRVLLSYFASMYVRFITGLPVKDATAGFICFRREVLEAINFEKIQFVGYAFQVELKFKAWLKGFKIKEVSVIFTNRALGKSKMNTSIFSEAIFGIMTMKLRSIFNRKQYEQK
ncbi:polyprenol monophosphomannose synthase [Spongiivirga citrea]|uniref:Glycosyltransferase n=1 Tax=Spongiivirga citrea TaxID=1481457 RepID=A0A6M0CMA8_9FLAO|nr:polyprenol monophosphomannose synthase [Spongiivirga citrea]NER16959.1 glycosyltransferase [Spongiivirga citrea]